MGEQQKKTLAEEVVELLKVDELTVTTAESCTGGLVAARLVDVPGVSEVFKQGFITYSNKAKRKLLNVKKTTLKEFGAVSEKPPGKWPRALFWQVARTLRSLRPVSQDRTAERKRSRWALYISAYLYGDRCMWKSTILKAIGAKYGRVPCRLLWRF